VKKFAEAQGEDAQWSLERDLEWIGDFGSSGHIKTLLFKDQWVPHSFSFHALKRDRHGVYSRWMVGGLIYHEHANLWNIHT
jgi:hypothetical protein